MELFLMVSLLVVAVLLIGIILIQQGKGAEMGASFGAGGSNTLFGAPGAGNFLTKSTTILAIVFFALALAIGYTGSQNGIEESSLLEQAGEAATELDAGESATSTEIPTEAAEVINTEIPVEQAETLATEIPTAIQEKTEEVQADAADAVKTLEETVEAAKEEAEEAVEEVTEEKDGDK